MAITKSVSGQPVRGNYVSTIADGRKTLRSGFGFGVPRQGGLQYAQVDGLTGGGTAAARMLAAKGPSQLSPRLQELQHYTHVEEQKVVEEQYQKARKEKEEAFKADAEAAKKVEELQKKMDEKPKQAAKAPVPNVAIVTDPVTKEEKVVAFGSPDPAVLDDPKALLRATEAKQKSDEAAKKAQDKSESK